MIQWFRVGWLEIDHVGIDEQLAAMLEIDRDARPDGGLDLSDPPIRAIGMTHESAGNEMAHSFILSQVPPNLKPGSVSGESVGIMSEKNPLRLVELIAARMSHDLVGPVGATVNGVELLAEDQAADAEVVRLIGHSARQSSRRLQVFRAIYGTAGALPAGAPFAAASQLFAGMLDGEKVSAVPWLADPALEAAAGRSGARVALLAAFLLVEALPRGGEVRFAGKFEANVAKLEILASGQGARLFEEVSAALAGKVPVEELTAKAAPAELLRQLVAGLAGSIALAAGKDSVTLSIVFSALGDG